MLGLRAAWSASHALAGTIENNEAGRCPEAPRLPRECQPDTEHGSNIWLLHSGLRPERLKHATEEFRRIGWRFKRVGPSGDDAHGCLAARRGRCARGPCRACAMQSSSGERGGILREFY